MPVYIKNNRLVQNKVLYKVPNISLIANHINSSFATRLVGKNPSTDINVYTVQDPYSGDGVFTRNPSCWINGVTNISCFSPAQLSNASWNVKAGTLITKKHVLFAKHYLPAILSGGTPIIFVDENNNVVRRNVISISSDPSSDIGIGLLDNEVPDNIKIAKVLPVNYTNYFDINNPSLNISAVALDQQEKALAKNCYSISSSIFFNNYSDSSWTETIVAGDSGNPVFFIIDNELVVLTTWYTASYGPFVTYYYNTINNIINSLSPSGGYSLTPINLDLVYIKYK